MVLLHVTTFHQSRVRKVRGISQIRILCFRVMRMIMAVMSEILSQPDKQSKQKSRVSVMVHALVRVEKIIYERRVFVICKTLK